ncbi:MAG: hypothetical protein ACTHOO_05235 [Alcanivorax sp.]
MKILDIPKALETYIASNMAQGINNTPKGVKAISAPNENAHNICEKCRIRLAGTKQSRAKISAKTEIKNRVISLSLGRGLKMKISFSGFLGFTKNLYEPIWAILFGRSCST